MSAKSTVFYVRFGGPAPGVIGRRVVRGDEPPERADSAERGDGSADPLPPGRTMSGAYSYKEVARLFDISEERLRYWDRSGFLSPSGHDGRRRCYTFQDLIGVRSAKTLLENGVSLQRARRILKKLSEEIPKSTHPLGRLRIMSDSKTVVVTDEERSFEADSGQLLIDFSVKSLEEEVVADLAPKKDRPRTAYEWYLEGCRLDEDEATLAEAEEAYHRAIHLDPALANAYTNLGNLLYRTGSREDAKALYQKAIEVDPNQPEAHYNLGFLEFEDDHYAVAERCFSRAVELDATFADAHFNVAITLIRLGELERARRHLHQYLRLEPTGSWAEVAKRRLKDLE